MIPIDLDPGTSPTLRISIRRTITAGIFSRKVLCSDDLSAITTVRFDNAVFVPGAGIVLRSNRWTSISFPDPSTLQIAVRPATQRVVRGQQVAIFVPSLSTVSNLGVLLSNPSSAVVGEITQVLNLGRITLSVADSNDGSTLPPSLASRQFALRVPNN